ncbi:lipoprotein [Spiroplasma tabanidicola]|uniref:Spiralin n=1 Tax=Spiroplasma tabanidicola TaxID=324079 RepID=A0A6I6CHC2_9MOLU|nr:lipoprotein [Spiroplasma tabanidicola]QGS51423.1 hypothetical protein STABA_v1c00560 [Spiroplasma tabanidicola]
MKKLLSILGAMGMVATSGSVAVACNKTKASQFGDKFVNSTVEAGSDLTLALKVATPVKDADVKAESDKVATATVKTSIAKDSDSKGEFNLVISGVAEGTATIKVTYGTITESIKVTVSKATIKDLKDVVKVVALGDLSGAGENPTVDEVVAQVNAKNEGLNLTKEDVTMSGDKLTEKATLKAVEKSTKFKGSVEVSYTYKKETRKDLSGLSESDLTVAPAKNDEVEAKKVVLAKINEKLSIEAAESTDITFSEFKAATESSKPGSIIATAVKSSALVKGSPLKFTLTFKASDLL